MPRDAARSRSRREHRPGDRVDATLPARRKLRPELPDVCTPPPPPDLDCKDISARRFTVRWDVPDPDPQGFDGNHDGVG